MEPQTMEIIEKFKDELDVHGIGGQVFRATQVLDEIKKLHDKIEETLDNARTALTPRQINFNLPCVSPDIEEQKEDGEDLIVIGELPAKENPPTILVYNEGDSQEAIPFSVRKPKVISDLANNIPPYRVLSTHDVKLMKNGQFKLNMMRYLINAVYRAADFVNLPHLVVKEWTPRIALDLYNATKHVFFSPNTNTNAKRRYEAIVWKTYYNMLIK
eukprot:9807875-Ditylum_brightwellii.AAC.1